MKLQSTRRNYRYAGVAQRRIWSVLYFSAKYLATDAVEDIKTVIVALQPVALVLISAIADEDGQALKAEATAAMSRSKA